MTISPEPTTPPLSAPEFGATRDRPTPVTISMIPRGTSSEPAIPVAQVFPVEDLGKMANGWSNDQKDMEIEIYFDPKTSNLSQSYNIQGLQPVVRKGSLFLLRDARPNFYEWSSDGELGLNLITEADTLEKALEAIIYRPLMMETQPVANNLLR